MVQYEKEYKIIESDGLKGLMVEEKIILPPEFERINIYIPGDEQGTTVLLPYVVVIATDINGEYYIFTFKPMYEGLKIMYVWKAPQTSLHTPWKLSKHHIVNQDLGVFNLDGSHYFNHG